MMSMPCSCQGEEVWRIAGDRNPAYGRAADLTTASETAKTGICGIMNENEQMCEIIAIYMKCIRCKPIFGGFEDAFRIAIFR